MPAKLYWATSCPGQYSLFGDEMIFGDVLTVKVCEALVVPHSLVAASAMVGLPEVL